ncbi:MAG: hypothetical protein HZC55_13785 [Verrucomicrobia bacterium]|nr:hypothetical protein [Verrucomicrobiota bacterium]
MLLSRRDYLLRIIDEAGRMLARAVNRRGAGAAEEALDAIVRGCERLFGLEMHELFQFNAEQQYAMLIDVPDREVARNRVLMYAALNLEAGRVYQASGKSPLARTTWIQALRLRLRAQLEFSPDNLPAWAPAIAHLRTALGDGPLDPDTAALLAAAEADQKPPPAAG